MSEPHYDPESDELYYDNRFIVRGLVEILREAGYALVSLEDAARLQTLKETT